MDYQEAMAAGLVLHFQVPIVLTFGRVIPLIPSSPPFTTQYQHASPLAMQPHENSKDT